MSSSPSWLPPRKSDLGNFLTLDAVPLFRWSAAEAELLDHVFEVQSSKSQDQAIHLVIQDIVGQLKIQCEESPVGTLRLALCLFRYSRTNQAISFALEVATQASDHIWTLRECEQRELHQHLDDLSVRYEREDSVAKQIVVLLKILKSQDLLVAASRPEFTSMAPVTSLLRTSSSSPALSSYRSSTAPTSWSPGSGSPSNRRKQPVVQQRPKSNPSDREYLPVPKKPPPPAWWGAKQIPWLPGQPVFLGEQFAVPKTYNRPVGRQYFQEYQRCHPSNF
eukprot:TRINITY_DN63956_c0_g1_i1.p1 TRINITY_DN63956_c0_g1~~TRINITY_DN63956_c0_g1_i1.p1  ORF type:complete len:296 (+),score=29.48 TRINITY_DN63956_c0_g1_i1:55-888(+)